MENINNLQVIRYNIFALSQWIRFTLLQFRSFPIFKTSSYSALLIAISDGILIILKRRMLRIRKQANPSKRLSKTSSNQITMNMLSKSVSIVPKDVIFDSDANHAKIHTNRVSARLNRKSFEQNFGQLQKLQRKSKIFRLDSVDSEAVPSFQNTQGDTSILVSVKSAFIYPKNLHSASKQNKIYRRSLIKATAFNFSKDAFQQGQYNDSLMGSFVSRMNQTEIIPLSNDSFDGKPEVAHPQRPLMKNKTKRLTQIVVKNHELAICQNIHKKFEQNLEYYLKFIKNECISTNFPFHQLPSYPKGFLRYYLDNGFNKKIIKQAIIKRWWWSEHNTTQDISQASLIWTESSQDNKSLRKATKGFKYQMSSNTGNNEPYNQENLAQILTQKSYLKLDSHFYGQDYSISDTLKILDDYGKIKLNENIRYPLTYNFANQEEIIRFTQRYFAKGNHGNQSSNPLWLIKNKKLNILRLCSNYKEIRQFLKENQKYNSCFTVQEFISNPFLYANKKVDFKAYILVTRLNNITRSFWWKEGCTVISIEDYMNSDPLMHMATDSQRINNQKVEKKSTKLPFSSFNELCLQSGFNFLQEVLPIMKQTAKHFVSSKLSGFRKASRPTFEILEFSYILGESRTPWLINVKPGFNHPIQSVMSSMIDDALKLTSDLIFPPPSEWPLAKRFFMNKGYASNEFQLLFDQSGNQFHQCKGQSFDEGILKQTIIEIIDIQESNLRQ